MEQRLTRNDIAEYLGDVSDELAVRIMALGATRDELAAAARAIEIGEGEESSAVDERIQELCRVIADELGEEIWSDR